MSVLWPEKPRALKCRVCGHKTTFTDLVCGFCRSVIPDPHEAAQLRDEAMRERYS